jgi:mannosyl-3-phosphoglycerate phosphatase
MSYLPISPGRPLVLFTDLDGTLIDHHTYSTDVARRALHLLTERGVPMVFCSSKTFAEQIHLQRELGISQPFILENGSAVAVPKGYFSTSPAFPRFNPKVWGEGVEREEGETEQTHDLYVFAHADAASVRAELTHFQGVKGFWTASDAELSAATGLSGEALKRARDRWFTETLLTPLDAEQVDVLQKNLAEKGWLLSRGGRFFTLQSAQVDKGKAVQWLKEVFRQNIPGAPLFAAIGDSPNDVPMLAAVDFPFLVQKHDGTWAEMEIQGLVKIESIGPTGFLAAVKILLGDYYTTPP